MVGLTEKGFERKRLADIKADLENQLKLSFGNEINLKPESVFGQLIGVLSLPIAELWEQTENTYLSQSPSFAEGVKLDEVAALNGLTRRGATATSVQAIVYGEAGTVIPGNSQVRVAGNNTSYILKDEVTLANSNAAMAEFEVNTVANTTVYSVTINSVVYSFTSSGSASIATILSGLANIINTTSPNAEATVTGNRLRVVANSTIVNHVYDNSANLTIVEIGNRAFLVRAETGAIVLELNALNEIVTAVSGWRGVFNPYPADTGAAQENDIDFRARRLLSVSFAAQSTYDAIVAKLSALEEVDEAQVFVNNDTTTDSNGIPPQHIYAIVKGGQTADIAQVLYENVAAGIGQYGTVTYSILGDSGQSFIQKFDRPVETPLFLIVDIVNTGDLPVSVENDIKTNLINYFAATQRIGGDLIYSRLFDPIQDVKGFYVDALKVGKTASPTGTVNIAADIDELFTLPASNIIVNIT